ncbi:MAG: hypothetical protein ABSG70_00725 [Terriglobales bacterium]|jgi:hypothetical protein
MNWKNVERFALIVGFSLFVCCGLASAQTFGFASSGSGLYCNYEQLNSFGPGLYGGDDNLSACGDSVNATIAGIAGTIAPGQKVHGSGVFYGDNIYALEGDLDAQWEVFTLLKCNKLNPKTGKYKGGYGWVGVASMSGVVLGTNYGYLSCTLPSPPDGDALMRGKSMGKIALHKQ